MIRAAVTGASGMIGRALVSALLAEDVAVTAFVRKGSGAEKTFPDHPHLSVIPLNLDEMQNFDGDGMHCDWFFHLAWEGTTGAAREDEETQIRNIEGTMQAAKLAARLGADVFVGAGSQAEFGRHEGMISPDTPANPENAYGTAKLCAGFMSRSFCKREGIRHIWMRIFSVYGPYQTADSVIMQGICGFLSGKEVPFTKGEQNWDYLYVSDAARALVLAARYGKDGSVYCLGSGKARPISEYIALMYDAAGRNGKALVGALPYEKNQVMSLLADIGPLKRDTGFVPEVTFEEGIGATVEWVRKYGKENQYYGSLLQ